MLEIKDRYKFIRKHIDTCTPVQLYEHHLYYRNTFFGTDCPKKTALYGDFMTYLIRFVMEYRPEVGINALCREYGVTITKEWYENGYIEFLLKIAAAEEFFGDYLLAAYFSRKALDMVDYFHPYLNKAGKEKIFQENEKYRLVKAIYDDYKEHLNDEYYHANPLNWEKEFYTPASQANQNFKYRIHW